MPLAAPAAALLFEHALGGVGDGGYTLDAALVGQRVAARPGQRAVGERQLADFVERDERNGAESELSAASADDEPLDPASGPGRLDEQIQPVGNRESLRQRESNCFRNSFKKDTYLHLICHHPPSIPTFRLGIHRTI